MSDSKKIFCISTQRNGTTSLGLFFKEHGYKCAGWRQTKKNNWGKLVFDGDYDSVFASEDFINNKVFEDNPWGSGVFYKYLFYRFPDSDFILFTRDGEKWFQSMKKHSDGKTLGNTFRHCCFYNREDEYYKKMGVHHHYDISDIDNLFEIDDSFKKQYISIYNNRNRQIIDFFKAKDPESKRFIHLNLEQKDKWVQLGKKFGFLVNSDYEVHVNKTS